MDTRTFERESPDGPLPIYEAVPDNPDEGKGAVIVVQEAFGVNDHIEDVTRRFADAGYHAVAPHLFHRTGSPRLGYDDFSKVMEHFAALDDDAILRDLDTTISYLNESSWYGPEVAAVGFCFGGRVTFLLAARRKLGACVGFYGGGIVTARVAQFPALVDEAATLKTPWLGLFGDQDQSIAVDDVETLRAELESKAPVPREVLRYAHAGRGFHCDHRES